MLSVQPFFTESLKRLVCTPDSPKKLKKYNLKKINAFQYLVPSQSLIGSQRKEKEELKAAEVNNTVYHVEKLIPVTAATTSYHNMLDSNYNIILHSMYISPE